MLRGIPENISPELLKALADMGHGDLIVIADNFYPAVSKAKDGITINCKGNTAAEMVESILKLMPLDVDYCEYPVEIMKRIRDLNIPFRIVRRYGTTSLRL